MSVKFYIDTLGCAKNEYDSQVLAADLLKKGAAMTTVPEDADILIVNTCGFIEAAKKESIDHIFAMADLKGERKKLVVTGCLSERYHKELVQEMPEVDIFVGVNEYDDLASILLDGESHATDQVHGEVEEVLPYRERVLEENAYTAVLKIAEGCNNYCSFCAIPKIRGPYRSMKMEDCVRAAEEMANRGIKELQIIAQDTSQYGIDLYGERNLPELLKKLCRIDGIEWIRLFYVYDDGITDELIDVIREEPKICEYIDMPIQHIADPVLKRMRRHSTGDSIRETVTKLRARIPNVHIRTTLLVGFPGETEEDFEALMDFIREFELDRVGVFAFSEEEGTPSFEMDGKLPEDVKEERRDRIMELQADISRKLNEKKIGSTFDVIIDEVLEEGLYSGRTRYDAPEIDCEVTFRAKEGYEPGMIIPVTIVNAFEYDLEGEEVSYEFA